LALGGNKKMKYKLLEKGEPLQKGDQFLEDDCQKWSYVPWYFLKCKFSPSVMQPIRRITEQADVVDAQKDGRN